MLYIYSLLFRSAQYIKYTTHKHTPSMKLRFTHVCLLCVVVLATGEEHEHGFDHHEVEINKSARAAKVSGTSAI